MLLVLPRRHTLLLELFTMTRLTAVQKHRLIDERLYLIGVGLVGLVDHSAHVAQHGEQVVAEEKVLAGPQHDLLGRLVLRLKQTVPLHALKHTTTHVDHLLQGDTGEIAHKRRVLTTWRFMALTALASSNLAARSYNRRHTTPCISARLLL
jgi:hypothetical protein